MRALLIGLSLLGLGSYSTARADFVVPTTTGGYSWNRPTTTGTNATFQAWETFTSVTGPNAPQTVNGAGTGDPAVVTTANFNGFGGPAASTWSAINPGGTANAFDANAATSGSIITSGGNIYSFSGVVIPRLVIPNNLDGVAGNNPTGATTLLLQVRAGGTPIDGATVRLVDPISGTEISPFLDQVLANSGSGMSAVQDRMFQFVVGGNADSYTINFSAAGASMSMARVAVDTHWDPTAPVPEPSLMLMIGGAGLWVWRRSRLAPQQAHG
jgi:hypothetical protein